MCIWRPTRTAKAKPSASTSRKSSPRRRRGRAIYRVMFNEITKKAVAKAFEKPGQVNVNLVDAQQARRVLDRLVGYKISPLLWDKVRRGLSAGRVQTVALRVIVEREREIRAFVAKEYWTIDADLAAKKPPALTARLTRINGQAAEIGSTEAAARRGGGSSKAPRTRCSRFRRAKSAVSRWRRSSLPPCSRNRRASCASA